MTESLLKTVIMIGLASPSELEQLNKTNVDLLSSLGLIKKLDDKTYEDLDAHLARCKKLNIDPDEYDEDVVKEKYEFIFGGFNDND